MDGSKVVEVGAEHLETSRGEKVWFDVLAIIELNRAPRLVAEAWLGDRFSQPAQGTT